MKPPHFFKRLDKFIKKNGLRAHDVFKAIDQEKTKSLTYPEIVDGLSYIGFKISDKERDNLQTWLDDLQIGVLGFKDFTLALNQRSTIPSPSTTDR